MRDKITLIGDIGGTNARFALTSTKNSSFYEYRKMKCADYITLSDAIESYLKEINLDAIDNAFLAVAAPIFEEKIKVINSHWLVDRKELARKLNIDSIHVINDFESIAYAIEIINKSNYQAIGPLKQAHTKKFQYNIGIIGPGTGLGGAGLRKDENKTRAYAAELGHVGFASQSELQLEIVEVLRGKYNRVVNETVVSGPGLRNIHWALHCIKNKRYEEYSSEEIFKQIHNSEIAKLSVDLFFEMLGQIAGDFALAIGAFDGILITGDLINSNSHLIQESLFRFGFENKDNYQDLMQNIPTSIINIPEVGLLGIYQFYNLKQAE